MGYFRFLVLVFSQQDKVFFGSILLERPLSATHSRWWTSLCIVTLRSLAGSCTMSQLKTRPIFLSWTMEILFQSLSLLPFSRYYAVFLIVLVFKNILSLDWWSGWCLCWLFTWKHEQGHSNKSVILSSWRRPHFKVSWKESSSNKCSLLKDSKIYWQGPVQSPRGIWPLGCL